MNTKNILIILSINHIAISESYKIICLPQKPFQTDYNCGDVCVKKDDSQCINLQAACKQCSPANYSFFMLRHLNKSSNESQCLISNESDEKLQTIINTIKKLFDKINHEKDEKFSNKIYNSLKEQYDNINNLEMSEFEKCLENVNKFNKYYKSEIINCIITKSPINEEMKLSLNCLYVSINIISKYIEDHQPSICVSDSYLVCTFDGFSDMISSHHLAERICESILYAMCSLMKLSENEVNKEFWKNKLEKLFLNDKISEENKLASCVILVQMDITNEYLINKLFEYLDKIGNIDCQDYFGFSKLEIISAMKNAKKKLANIRRTTINKNKEEKFQTNFNEVAVKLIQGLKEMIICKEYSTLQSEETFERIIHENNETLLKEIKEVKEKHETFERIIHENNETLLKEIKEVKEKHNEILLNEIKQDAKEKDEKYQTHINEEYSTLYSEYSTLHSVVRHKLRFQIANQFDETELFISKFDNVIKLKKSICDRNMNMNDYKRMIMKYKGVTLDNNQYLLSCIDSTNIPIFCEFDNNVDVNAMIVIILKCDNIYNEMLQIWKHQQIKDLKIIISKFNKTNYKDLLIFYKSTQLDDDKTIDYYKIEDNDWINAINKSEEIQNITMQSIFTAKETLSIELSKSETVSDIINKSIQKIQHKMTNNHDFVIFLNKKLLQNDKFIYEYNIDSKSLVEFCYFKSMDDIKDISRYYTFMYIYLFKAAYHCKGIDKPILLKGYDKSVMEYEYHNDLSVILRKELEMFHITKYHPRFMQLNGLYINHDWIYIGMENSTKIPLRTFLYSNNKISRYEMSKWAYQMLEGLKFLHNHNIIMKDMNSMDIWIDGNHDVKLPSFNLTEYLDHLPTNINEYKNGLVGFKPGILTYVAPEILKSEPHEANVDVWSLGVIMIEIITRAQLFTGLSESQVVDIIKESGTIEYDKTNKPPDLVNFIDCCVKADPKERATIDQLMKHEFIEKYLL